MIRKLILSFSLLGSSALHAAELDLTLGNDSVRGEYVAAVGTKRADNVAALDAGVLYSEDQNRDRILGHVGLMIFGDTGAKKANVKAGVGVRVVVFDADGLDESAAISLGGTLTGRVPDFNRLGGRAWAFYAPGVSSFSDLDGYLEYGASLDYQLIRQAFIVVGYRKLEAELEAGGDVRIESSGFFGLRMVF
ncbi:MAG: YfaZ family outer membrane protein [Oceanococcus sp.]